MSAHLTLFPATTKLSMQENITQRVVFGGHSRILGAEASDEELILLGDGNKAVWRAAGTVRKQFTSRSPILQVQWCRFENTGLDTILCMLHGMSLSVHTQDGDMHSIPLPDEYSAMWPLPRGLLLTSSKVGEAPVVVLHPLEPVQPIQVKGWAPDEHMIWSSLETPTLVSYSQSSQRLAVWNVTLKLNNRYFSVTPSKLSSGPQGCAVATAAAVGNDDADVLQTPDQQQAQNDGNSQGQRRLSMRLPNGSLSPLAFQPQPRKQSDGHVLLPSQEHPVSLSLKWSDHNVGLQGAPTEAHLFGDTDSVTPLLCLHCPNLQRALVLAIRTTSSSSKNTEIVPYFDVAAKSVAAIMATRQGNFISSSGSSSSTFLAKDLLILQPGGDLVLHVGNQHVINVVPLTSHLAGIDPIISKMLKLSHYLGGAQQQQLQRDISQMSGTRHSPGADSGGDGRALGSTELEKTGSVSTMGNPTLHMSTIGEALDHSIETVGLKDAVGNRVSLVLKNGHTIRACLPLAPIVDFIYRALEAIKLVMPAEEWWGVYMRWLSTQSSKLLGGGEYSQWLAFENALLHRLGVIVQVKAPHSNTSTSVATDVTASASGEGGGGDWEWLLKSEQHGNDALPKRLKWAENPIPPRLSSVQDTAAFIDIDVLNIIQALHSLYEDIKMDRRLWHYLPQFAVLLSKLSGVVMDTGLQEFYDTEEQNGYSNTSTSPGSPPSLLMALEELLLGQQNTRLPVLIAQGSAIVQRSTDLVVFYRIISDGLVSRLEADNKAQADTALLNTSILLIETMSKRGWTHAELDALPYGVAGPLFDVAGRLQNDPPSTWPPEALALTGMLQALLSFISFMGNQNRHITTPPSFPQNCAERFNVTCKAALSKAKSTVEPTLVGSAIVTTPLGKMARSPQKKTRASKLLEKNQGDDLTASLADPSRVDVDTSVSPLPYKQHLQISGALHYLVQEEPPEENLLKLVEPYTESDGMESLSDPNIKRRFNKDLRLQEVRRLLRSSVPVVLKTGNVQVTEAEGMQQQQIKLMVLAFRTMALNFGRGALTLSTVKPLPTEALRIPTMCLAGKLPDQSNAIVNLDLSNTLPAPGGGGFSEYTAWAEFHNGVASGLRLTPGGQMLTRTWIVYNKPKEPSYTHAGMILSLGLTGQLSCLAATDLYRYLAQEHDATIISVLLGMSAAKRGSMDATISKMLFLHMPSRHPSNYPELEISSLVQAAALTGVGLLFQGSAHRLMAEIMLEEMARRPGPTSRENDRLHDGVSHDREGYALAAGIGLGLITLGKGSKSVGLSDLNIEERVKKLMTGGRLVSEPLVDVDPGMGDSNKVRTVSPRDSVGNRTAGSVAEDLAAAQGASQVVLEGSVVNLDATGPAATLALGLMYLQTNSVKAASLFEIPQTAFAMRQVRPQHLMLRIWMRALVLWDSVQPSNDWVQEQVPLNMRGSLKDALAERNCPKVYALCYGFAGACLALGVRFAGTGNEQARQVIHHTMVNELLAIKLNIPEPPGNENAPIDRLQVEQCVSACALSLAAVMAGTGDVSTMKILRGLLKRVAVPTAGNATLPSTGSPPTSSITYGSHCATSLALGWLFLSSGGMSFGNDLSSAGALIIALYPKWPISTTDNRYYLQALRHMYVLATLCKEDLDARRDDAWAVKVTRVDDQFVGAKLEGEACILDTYDALTT